MDTSEPSDTPVSDSCVAPVTSTDVFIHNESANAYVPEKEVTTDETEVESAEQIQDRNEKRASEIQVFRSVEEAYMYIKNYEIATNSKFIKNRAIRMSVSDVQSLKDYRIFYDYTIFTGNQKVIINDGLLTICLGYEERKCQYGPQKIRGHGNVPEKKRKVMSSKKLGCPACIRIRKVLKFPEYSPENARKYTKMKMAEKLKENFSEETKRFILVYVHIDSNHNHEPCPVIRPPKHKALNHKKSKGCNRIVNDSAEHVRIGLVLKKSASLKGKDLSNLALQLKDVHEIPALIAQPRKDQKLEDMDIHELMSLYYEITGQVPNEMFAKACKPFTRQNLILLLHLCIVFANASMDKQTHISVRLKGTEREFTPVECYDEGCAVVDSHMHCPFCSKTDSYTDVSLLKAHYTKQHVDKALEFSGLKILRCFNKCEIDTKVIHNKTFSGGHWHCFACSNAIERRCDTFIHYERHLNAFGSSFQVHIAQDVNPVSSHKTTTYEIQNTLHGIEMRMSNTESTPDFHVIGMNSMRDTVNISPSKYVGGHSPSKRPYTDTGLGVHDDVLYVEEDEHGNVLSTYTAEQIPTAGQENVTISYPENSDVKQLKKKIRELEISNKKMETHNNLQKSYVEFLEKTISDLKEEHSKKVEKLDAEIEDLKKQLIIDDGVSESLDNEENNSDSSQESCVKPANTSSAVPNKLNIKKTNSKTEKKSSMVNDVVMDKVEDQLNGIKKEMENLKNNLCNHVAPGNNVGTNPMIQNPAPLCYISNQGIMTPYILPHNMTGLPYINFVTAQNVPMQMFQNTAALNSQPLNTPQNTLNTRPGSCIWSGTELPKTDTALRSNEPQLAQQVCGPFNENESDNGHSDNKTRNNNSETSGQYVVMQCPTGSFLVPMSNISGLDKMSGTNTLTPSENDQTSTAGIANIKMEI